MSVKVAYNPVQFVSVGGETDVLIPWWFSDAAQINVGVDNVPQTITTDYTVTLPTNETSPDGKITFVSPLVGIKTVIIFRTVPPLQPEEFLYGGKILSPALESRLDGQFMRLQEEQVGAVGYIVSGDATPILAYVDGSNNTLVQWRAVHVDGTSTITRFDMDKNLGHLFTIIFSNSNYSITSGTVGVEGEPILAGGLDWTDSKNSDTITFVCDGFNYFEVSRNVT